MPASPDLWKAHPTRVLGLLAAVSPTFWKIGYQAFIVRHVLPYVLPAFHLVKETKRILGKASNNNDADYASFELHSHQLRMSYYSNNWFFYLSQVSLTNNSTNFPILPSDNMESLLPIDS